MDRFLCSIIEDGIALAPGATLAFEDFGIRIKGILTRSDFLEYGHIERIIYSKAFRRAKIISTVRKFTIATLFIGKFLACCQKHGVKLEPYRKSNHNPDRSGYRFWYHR